MNPNLENPVDFDQLEDRKRFFIFGNDDIRDKLHPMLCARFPTRFYGFLTEKRVDERHADSAYSFRYWEEALPLLGPGDYVFITRVIDEVMEGLVDRGVRIGLPFNIRTIYATYETPTFLHFCKTWLNGRGIALDIGGNTGLTGAMLAGFCEHVHIFEANPEMERAIHGTVCGLNNISVIMKAVSRTSGTAVIYPVGTNNTSMVARDKVDPVRVPCTSIDDFCREEKVVPAVIKIDVEGVDGEVILGAERTIAAHRPLLFLEHPLANAQVYNTDLELAEEALALLRQTHRLLAYPTMDQLLPAEAMGMPLERFLGEHTYYPVNVAAIPKE
ncbi:MAG: FkbM family methyltransferase [Acidobacteriota bacterium]|nr:FkbM family methyltransferase [Acidobacteriota bacterium]